MLKYIYLGFPLRKGKVNILYEVNKVNKVNNWPQLKFLWR